MISTPNHKSFLLSLLALVLSFIPSILLAGETQNPASQEVNVTASALNVRDVDGNILCTVPRDTRLKAVGKVFEVDALMVHVDSSVCPSVKEGFVASKYVQPKTGANEFTVDVTGLSFRSAPSFEDSWKCSLPKDTKVIGSDQPIVAGEDVTWVNVKLKNPVDGCPDEGYVANSYISAAAKLSDLPLVLNPNEECADCDNMQNKKKLGGPLGVLSKVFSGIANTLTPDRRPSPFVDEIRKMIKKPKYRAKGFPTSRGLAQIPLIGKRGNIGPCGSFHYNPDKPVGVDSYTNPLTACVLISALQDWKKNHCPNGDDGCTFAWGDISHKIKPEFSGHRTHTNGQCLDIRPMRKGEFEDAPLTYDSSDYDKKTMKKFVKFLKSKGATSMLFNDTTVGTSYKSGHHNHLHICFKDNRVTRDVCNNLEVDTNVCPELQ